MEQTINSSIINKEKSLILFRTLCDTPHNKFWRRAVKNAHQSENAKLSVQSKFGEQIEIIIDGKDLTIEVQDISGVHPENNFISVISKEEFRMLYDYYMKVNDDYIDPEPIGEIQKWLLNYNEFLSGVDTLYKFKPKKKIVNKFLKELSELTVKLLQNKNGETKASDEDILRKMVDVQMHLILLQKFFLKEDIRRVTENKVIKMVQSDDIKKYRKLEEDSLLENITKK